MARLTHAELTELGDQLAMRFNADSTVVCVHDDHVPLEVNLHELCHMAVFEKSPKNVKNIGAYVQRRFERLASRDAILGGAVVTERMRLNSDLSECKAVAVQLRVAALLGLDIYEDSLLRNVKNDCLTMRSADVEKTIAKWRPEASTHRRAKRVLHWLKPYIKEVTRAQEVLHPK